MGRKPSRQLLTTVPNSRLWGKSPCLQSSEHYLAVTVSVPCGCWKSCLGGTGRPGGPQLVLQGKLPFGYLVDGPGGCAALNYGPDPVKLTWLLAAVR